MNNYFISKDNKSGEIVYLEYDKEGYKVTPKRKKEDAIEVNKIVFVSPKLTEKLIKKKIDHKLDKLLYELNLINIDDEDNDSGNSEKIRDMLKEAEKFRLSIINNYKKYLGNSYITLTLKKMQIIIDGYKAKLYTIKERENEKILINMFNQMKSQKRKAKVDNMILLDGKEVKLKVLEELKEKLTKLDRNLGLVVIQVGNNPASNVYVKQKNKMAENLGYNFNHIKLDSNITEKELLSIINELNNNDLVDGILVQMPIPKSLDTKRIQNAIVPDKDVDGLTDINMGRLVHNRESLVPCTPIGIIDLLDYYNIPIEGKNVVIIGRSDLVGKPMATLMTNRNATVTLCHSKTSNLEFYTKSADILVAAIGIPKYIKKNMVKEGAVIIDVGINRMEDNSLCGDVDFDNVKDKVSYITPVPGGVGQMTVAELAVNTYKAHVLRKNK